ncbi:MAG: hypothetical protein K2I27_12195, partial [Bacteroides sp.]|nr:hypothetical protein [Bacteroides sp.]
MACFLCGSTLLAQESNGVSANAGDTRTLSADSLVTTDACLDSLYRTLPEVMITGERPLVKA